MKADLHLHSTASDGTLAPDELIALAAELGFTLKDLTFSPVKGPEGNIEFLGHLCMEPGDALVPDIPALVAAAHETLKG